MAALGFDRLALTRHDRGGRVTYRMALDHPTVVARIAVLDVVPTGEVWRRADGDFARGYWHCGSSPCRPRFRAPNRRRSAVVLRPPARAGRGLGRKPGRSSPEILAAYRRILDDPEAVDAMREDSRAGASVDVADDDLEAGRQIGSLVLVLWSARGGLPRFTPTRSRSGVGGWPPCAAGGHCHDHARGRPLGACHWASMAEHGVPDPGCHPAGRGTRRPRPRRHRGQPVPARRGRGRLRAPGRRAVPATAGWSESASTAPGGACSSRATFHCPCARSMPAPRAGVVRQMRPAARRAATPACRPLRRWWPPPPLRPLGPAPVRRGAAPGAGWGQGGGHFAACAGRVAGRLGIGVSRRLSTSERGA
jgi:hypothetical protein